MHAMRCWANLLGSHVCMLTLPCRVCDLEQMLLYLHLQRGVGASCVNMCAMLRLCGYECLQGLNVWNVLTPI